MAILESLTLFQVLLGLGVAVLLFPRGRPAAVAAEGMLAFALGGAALQVGARAMAPMPVALAAQLEALGSFLAITNGLLLLGPCAVLVGLGLHRRSGAQGFPVAGQVLAALVGLTALLLTTWIVVATESSWAFAWAAIIAGATVACFQVGKLSRFGLVIRYVDLHWMVWTHWHHRLLAPRGQDVWWILVLVGGAVAVMVSPHLGYVVVGALAVAAAGHALAYRLWGGPRFPVLPLLAAPLIPFAIDVYQRAGAGGWSMNNPGLAPLTAEIEIGLLPLVAVAAWGLAGLWPVHGLVPRGVLAPVGGMLLARIGSGFLPAGLFYWQPLLSPLALVSIWWGALTGRRSLLVAGWGFQALVSDLPMGSRGAYFLLAVSAALALLPMVPERWVAPAGKVLIGLAVVGIAWSLPAMLQTQLVYSLLAVVAVAVAVWRRREE